MDLWTLKGLWRIFSDFLTGFNGATWIYVWISKQFPKLSRSQFSGSGPVLMDRIRENQRFLEDKLEELRDILTDWDKWPDEIAPDSPANDTPTMYQPEHEDSQVSQNLKLFCTFRLVDAEKGERGQTNEGLVDVFCFRARSGRHTRALLCTNDSGCFDSISGLCF